MMIVAAADASREGDLGLRYETWDLDATENLGLGVKRYLAKEKQLSFVIKSV